MKCCPYRRRYAQALGVAEEDLIETWAGLGEETIEPVIRDTGPILDPSNDDGLTAKMINDATKPAGNFPARHTIPEEDAARARELIGKYGG